jgi:AraC-like DNA-binding protein
MARTVFEGKFFKITHTIEEEGPHPSALQDYYDDTFTICTLLQGGGACYVEGNCYPLAPGDMMLMGLDEIRSFRFKQEGYHERISLYFSSALLSPFWDYELPLMQPFCGHAPGVGNKYSPEDYDSEKVSHILSDICHVMTDSSDAHIRDSADIPNRDDAKADADNCSDVNILSGADIREAKLHLLLLQLLFVLYEAYEKLQLPAPNHDSDSCIRDICKYIQENISVKLTYEHLQDRFLVSRYQLTEIFRRNTGMTLTEYILQKRLMKVISLVHAGTGIERAAFQAGFRNYSHFYKEFVKHKNISPQKYFGRKTKSLSGENEK